MWKRFGGIRVPIFFLFFLLTGAGTAVGACGWAPPLPPDKFVWPVSGDVSRAWSLDCRTDKGHRGIDISAPGGASVMASAAGNVSFTGYTPAEGGGITVTIDHPGGLRTTYLHLKTTIVSEGQYINQGEPIGFTDGSPLHFGIKLPSGGHDTYFNPSDLLPAMVEPGEETMQSNPAGAPEIDPEANTVAATPAAVTLPVPETAPVGVFPSTETSPAGVTPNQAQLGDSPLPASPFNRVTSPESPIVGISLPVASFPAVFPREPESAGVFLPETNRLQNASLTGELPNARLFVNRVPVLSQTRAAQVQSGFQDERKPARRVAIGFAVLLISAVAGAGSRIFNPGFSTDRSAGGGSGTLDLPASLDNCS